MSDFDVIYQQHGKMVFFFLLSICHDELLAEELTQETMFRAMMNIGSFRGESKISVWLCQIAKNCYYEWQKKNKRILSINETAVSCSDNKDIVIEFEEKDTAKQILYHLHNLPEPYKEVFMLHALGEISLKSISQLFGKSNSWARVTYYRAKTMIIEKMEEKNELD